MKERWFPVAMVVVTALIWFAASACSIQPSKVTQENYDQLKMGMKLEQVLEIMGPPQQSYPKFGMKQFTWVDGERHIHAKFVAERAVYYSSKNLKNPDGGSPGRQAARGH